MVRRSICSEKGRQGKPLPALLVTGSIDGTAHPPGMALKSSTTPH